MENDKVPEKLDPVPVAVPVKIMQVSHPVMDLSEMAIDKKEMVKLFNELKTMFMPLYKMLLNDIEVTKKRNMVTIELLSKLCSDKSLLGANKVIDVYKKYDFNPKTDIEHDSEEYKSVVLSVIEKYFGDMVLNEVEEIVKNE